MSDKLTILEIRHTGILTDDDSEYILDQIKLGNTSGYIGQKINSWDIKTKDN